MQIILNMAAGYSEAMRGFSNAQQHFKARKWTNDLVVKVDRPVDLQYYEQQQHCNVYIK